MKELTHKGRSYRGPAIDLRDDRLVEQIAETIFRVPFHGELSREFVRRQAVAALDALSGESE